MKTFNINLDSIETIKNFVKAVTKLDCEVDIISGRYVIDAKSIMGIFSIDLSKPVAVRVYAEGEELIKASEIIKPFEIEE